MAYKNFYWDLGEKVPKIPRGYQNKFQLGAAPNGLGGFSQAVERSFTPYIPCIFVTGALGLVLGWKLRGIFK